MCVITSCSNSECTDVGWLHQGYCPFKRSVNTFLPCVIMALFCGLSMESAGLFPFWKNITHKTWQVVHSTSNMWWQLVCWFIGDEAQENMLTQRVVRAFFWPVSFGNRTSICLSIHREEKLDAFNKIQCNHCTKMYQYFCSVFQ